MSLRLTVSKQLAMFVYETEEMTTTVTISADDDEPTIMSKLGKLTDFIRQQQPHSLAPVTAPGWTAQAVAGPPAVSFNKPFTGSAPVQPPSLAESIAQANATGWEMIMPGDD